MDPNKLITPDEAAEVLGITGNRARQLTRKGRLPAQKVRNRWLVIRAGDLALIENRKGGWPNGVPPRKFDLVVPIGKTGRKVSRRCPLDTWSRSADDNGKTITLDPA